MSNLYLSLYYIQIHGSIEDKLIESSDIPVIRAFNAADLSSLPILSNIAGYLFDAQIPGSGMTFDWKNMNNIPETDKLIFLAGGLNSRNVADAVKYVNPDVVDVSSGVELDSGRGKDKDKIRLFAANVRKNTAHFSVDLS